MTALSSRATYRMFLARCCRSRAAGAGEDADRHPSVYVAAPRHAHGAVAALASLSPTALSPAASFAHILARNTLLAPCTGRRISRPDRVPVAEVAIRICFDGDSDRRNADVFVVALDISAAWNGLNENVEGVLPGGAIAKVRSSDLYPVAVCGALVALVRYRLTGARQSEASPAEPERWN